MISVQNVRWSGSYPVVIGCRKGGKRGGVVD